MDDEPTERGVFPENCLVEILCGEEDEEIWVAARVLEVLQYQDRVRCYRIGAVVARESGLQI